MSFVVTPQGNPEFEDRPPAGCGTVMNMWPKYLNIRLAIVKLRLKWAGAVITHGSEMAFRIRFQDGQHPEFNLGPPGAELGCYVPEGTTWAQRNYGQGEGQVEIEGRVWGFYWNAPGNLDVILHESEIDLGRALEFVHAVAERVVGKGEAYELLVAGQQFDGVAKLPPRRKAPTNAAAG